MAKLLALNSTIILCVIILTLDEMVSHFDIWNVHVMWIWNLICERGTQTLRSFYLVSYKLKFDHRWSEFSSSLYLSLSHSFRHWSLNIKNVIIIKTSFRAYVVMHLHFLLVIFDLPSTFSISSSSYYLLPCEMYIKAASTLTHLGIDMAWLSFTIIPWAVVGLWRRLISWK